MNISEVIRTISYEVFCIICAILLVIFVPLTVILFSPIYIFRYCVQFVAWVWKPELHSMLSMSSPIMASDDIYTNPKNGIIVYAAARGDVDLELGEELIYKFINIKVAYIKSFLHLFGNYIKEYIL